MDTNLIMAMLEMLAHKNQVAPVVNGQNSVVISTIIAGAFLNALGLFLTYLKAASAKEDTATAAKTLTEIHTSVNSKETITAKKIEDLTSIVLKLTGEKATADERARNTATAADVKAQVKEQISEKAITV